ncbi:uncharacterized protein [Mytilus edulis]|uniref:uncharacterized protein n=1 Tax=Mytilus edulis TaxID=6550 RepID=UPI0039F04C64
MTETFKFRKRGNEEQYKHNKKVFVKVLEASSQLESENLNNDNIQTGFNFRECGISLDRHVKVAIEDSGVETGSHLYSIYPKMCELLLNSKSDNTVKSYFYAFRRWEKFITEHGQDALPAQPVHVALYLTNLLNNGSTSHPVSNALYGIKWAHEICRSGNNCKLIDKDKKLSYTAAREALLGRMRLVSPNCNIGLHSFRAGGATAAANANVNERCLKKHGRWKSDSSKDRYIVDSTEKRLQVSKKLGL